MGKMKRKKENRPNFLFLIPLIGVIVLLVVFNINLWNQRKITTAQLATTKEKLERVSGQEDIENYEEESDEKRIERMAREQLLLRKEGENVIVISREEEKEGEEETEKEEKEKGFFENVFDFLPWIDN